MEKFRLKYTKIIKYLYSQRNCKSWRYNTFGRSFGGRRFDVDIEPGKLMDVKIVQ